MTPTPALLELITATAQHTDDPGVFVFIVAALLLTVDGGKRGKRSERTPNLTAPECWTGVPLKKLEIGELTPLHTHCCHGKTC